MMSGGVTAEEMRGLYADDHRIEFLAKPFSMAELEEALGALGQAEGSGNRLSESRA